MMILFIFPVGSNNLIAQIRKSIKIKMNLDDEDSDGQKSQNISQVVIDDSQLSKDQSRDDSYDQIRSYSSTQNFNEPQIRARDQFEIQLWFPINRTIALEQIVRKYIYLHERQLFFYQKSFFNIEGSFNWNQAKQHLKKLKLHDQQNWRILNFFFQGHRNYILNLINANIQRKFLRQYKQISSVQLLERIRQNYLMLLNINKNFTFHINKFEFLVGFKSINQHFLLEFYHLLNILEKNAYKQEIFQRESQLRLNQNQAFQIISSHQARESLHFEFLNQGHFEQSINNNYNTQYSINQEQPFATFNEGAKYFEKGYNEFILNIDQSQHWFYTQLRAFENLIL